MYVRETVELHVNDKCTIRLRFENDELTEAMIDCTYFVRRHGDYTRVMLTVNAERYGEDSNSVTVVVRRETGKYSVITTVEINHDDSKYSEFMNSVLSWIQAVMRRIGDV